MSDYAIIYADPPWAYRQKGRGAAANHYGTMSTANICDIPIRDIAADNAFLFLWATSPNIADALKVVDAWGFKYKSFAFTWIKLTKDGRPAFGMGSYTRSNAEVVLLGTRGRPQRVAKNVSSAVLSGRLRHSAKPTVVRDRIVQLCGDVPRVELFARERVDGWSCWGNEVDGDLALEVSVDLVETTPAEHGVCRRTYRPGLRSTRFIRIPRAEQVAV
jgi:N6-adenosine-specific RNA methylase IME4